MLTPDHGAYPTHRDALLVGHIMCNLLKDAATAGSVTDADLARAHDSAARTWTRHRHMERVTGGR
jgi:hypothetical protein